MGWKVVFSFLFFLFVFVSLFVYFLAPFNEVEFSVNEKDTNFNSNFSSQSENLQFYENMRFSNQRISYRIEDCTLQKQDDMERAFGIVEGITILDFYPVSSGEEIFVTCSSENKIDGDLFIAGEGGPTEISKAGNFNVIFSGSILLLRDSKCPDPNIGIHELMHVLGFDHSENPNNIMYPVSKCTQEIGEDITGFINEIYSLPSQSDLVFENVSADISGRNLNTKFTVRNFGLADSEEFKVIISANGKSVKEVEMEEIEIGFGRTITLENIFVSQIKVEEIEFLIETSFQELDKENNKISLKVSGD